MKKTKQYTKSRLHEKLNMAKQAGCGLLGVILASALAISALAKTSDNDERVDEISQVTVCASMETPGTACEQREIAVNTLTREVDTIEELILTSENMICIRCTAYCDTGYTASGAWTTEGCLAGRREWLGRQCNLYRVNKDGTPGELIGTFTFKDTGFGLKELKGIQYPDGTIKSGASIDMWHPTEEECWEWVAQYGDYVYMEFIQ